MNVRTKCPRKGPSIRSLLLLMLALQSAHASDGEWKQRETAHGHPDLQGIWDFGTKTPLQRPAALGEKRAYTEGQAVDFENGLREVNRRMDAAVDLSKDAPVAGAKIGQEADAGSVDAQHDAKIWMGDSIGHYAGDTLIVHTINFRPEQSYSAMPMSEDLELTERFTRAGPDEIVYSFTVVDPNAYTRPFTGERTLKRAAPADRILEFACHEGNYAMTGMLAGARKEEEDAARNTQPVSGKR